MCCILALSLIPFLSIRAERRQDLANKRYVVELTLDEREALLAKLKKGCLLKVKGMTR